MATTTFHSPAFGYSSRFRLRHLVFNVVVTSPFWALLAYGYYEAWAG